MNLFLNKADRVIATTFADYWDQEEQARLDVNSKLIDYYIGEQEKYIKKYIQIQSIDDFPFYWSNITKKIIRRVAQVYKNPPVRLFNEKPNQKYEEVTKRKNNTMKIVNRQARLLGVVGVQPVVKDDHFEYFVLRRFQANFDDIYNPTKPTEIKYLISGSEKDLTAKYMYWSDEQNAIIDSNDNITPIEGNEEMENPYGVIPFVFCHSEEILDDFWNTGGNAEDLIIANEHINLKLSQMAHKFRFKSFDPIWISGDTPDNQEIAFNYDHALLVPEGSNVGTINQTHRFEDDINAIRHDIQMIERNWNLAGNWSLEGQAPSGFSLIVQNLEHFDDLDDQTDIARQWEEELLNMERTVGDVDGIRGVPDNMSVNFAEIKLPLSKQEEIADWEFKFREGLASKADYLKQHNPDISEKEIEQKLEEVANEQEITRKEPTVSEILGEGE